MPETEFAAKNRALHALGGKLVLIGLALPHNRNYVIGTLSHGSETANPRDCLIWSLTNLPAKHKVGAVARFKCKNGSQVIWETKGAIHFSTADVTFWCEMRKRKYIEPS